ncbi:colanic acid biosynthesis acetyltransferase WcaF [Segetibacter sp. 3557_3]|uniref:colanic acid biosynthesis acetyltransferase WcaF n=1 Tax=Segetibacter sp. 3557_3 TaxID=2547429 RepID=UPI0014046C3E|nr:colanic acid biosynthesis acetyltransferase WcaF [Segetibacter sp. 3557_3]
MIIRASVHTHFPWKVTIGDYSWIGDGVVLYSLADINIGNNVVISQKSYLCAGSHDYRYVEFPTTNSPITIEDECWLATDVFVAPGITVGKGTVVGARSSVFKSLPAGKICAGSPAVCFRDRETLSSFKQSHHPTD